PAEHLEESHLGPLVVADAPGRLLDRKQSGELSAVPGGERRARLARLGHRDDSHRGLTARSSSSRSSPGARLGDEDAEEDDRHAGVAGPSEPLTDPEADDPGHDRLELEDHRGPRRLDESLSPQL